MGCNCGRKKAQVTAANIPAANPPRPDKVDEVAEQLVATSTETVVADDGVRQVVRT